MIKSEMKKIVQIQHETLMRFLNNDAPEISSNLCTQRAIQQASPDNIDQQIYSVLKQQKMNNNLNREPVEFIIETKIKAVDAAVNKETIVDNLVHNPHIIHERKILSPSMQTNDKTNYFLKTFDKMTEIPKSSFVKIPLLETRLDSKPEISEFQLKIFEQKEFRKSENKISNSDSGRNLLKLKSEEKREPFNKYLKKLIEETHKTPTVGGFPLLRFNHSRFF